MKHCLIFLLILFISAVSCSENSGSQSDSPDPVPDGQTSQTKKNPPRKVRVEQITPGDVTSKIYFNAVIEAQRDVTVNSKITGEIVQMNFDIGSFVRKGDVVAAVEYDVQKTALDQAGLNLKQAELNFSLKEKIFSRDRKLFENKAISKESFEISETGYLTAELALNQAKTSLATAEINYSNCFIKAPFDGVIAERPVQLGQYVTIGTVIARIVDIANLQVVVGLTYEELLTYKKYKNKDMSIILPDGSTAPGSVRGVAEAPDRKTGLYSMKVLFASVKDEHERYVVFPGMQLKVSMNGHVHKKAFLTSRTNIRLLGSKYVVYVSQNGKAVEREVELITDDGKLRIVRFSDGSESAFRLIVTGIDALTDGREIEEM